MLDPWIIEEIRKREEAEQRQQRPVLEIPLQRPEPEEEPVVYDHEENNDGERGVVIVDFSI